MAFELDPNLSPELVPLAWLVGSWEGTGVAGYGDVPSTRFFQHVDFTAPQGATFLHYTAQSWAADEGGNATDLLSAETGFWQLVRPREDHDAGPGLLAVTAPNPYTTAESVESLRNDDGDFDLEVSIVQPNGIVELYTGRVAGARIDLATDVVARTKTAKDYRASTRMYGLVKGELLWAWDMAALGRELGTHASAQLKRIG